MAAQVTDASFSPSRDDLVRAVDLLLSSAKGQRPSLPDAMPETGDGEAAVLDRLAPLVIGGARRLGAPTVFAHMDPPAPWIAWAATFWNAALNQNLFHGDTAPAARAIETRVVQWLAPYFGMNGGHMCPGSTLANITAIWAAREMARITRVVASEHAHLSIGKAAHLLGLRHESVAVTPDGKLHPDALPDDLSDACLVLTAGGTSTGAIDPLDLADRAAWTHVDAAWAGPLCLTDAYKDRLAGLAAANSVAVSAHKWLFQPKESALVFFREPEAAHAAISTTGPYVATPNVGVLGSHGAMAVPLLATLMAWGRAGVADRVERCMAMAEDLYGRLDARADVETFAPPTTGVFAWRPVDGRRFEGVAKALPDGVASRTQLLGKPWVRQVAANPMADIDQIWAAIEAALHQA